MKIRNSLIHSREVDSGSKITELDEYKRQIGMVALLILKFGPASILVGICPVMYGAQTLSYYLISERGERGAGFRVTFYD